MTDVVNYVCEECPNIVGIPVDLPEKTVVECSECGFRATASWWREVADEAEEEQENS